MKMEHSKYQKAIFEFITNGSGHGIINSVAGSGKTYTLIESTKLIDKDTTSILLAFNKSIADELKVKCPSTVETSTLHSAGLKLLRNVKYVNIDNNKMNNIINNYEPFVIDKKTSYKNKKRIWNMRNDIKKIISLIKNTLTDYDNEDELISLFDFYQIEYDEKYQTYIKYIIEQSLQQYTTLSKVDFDDMLYLPVVLNINNNMYDYVFVDETQDLNASQLELILKLVKDTGRVIAVGDPHQSIYGFRGAKTDAMDTIKNKLDAKVFPLSVCYRCPTSHIENVKYLVPHIEAYEDAIEGEIENIYYNEFVDTIIQDDQPLILSRTNNICSKYALELISKGHKAVIKGKDFGKMLLNIVKSLKSYSINDMLDDLDTWREKEISKIKNNKYYDSLQNVVEDKYSTIECIINNSKNVTEVENTIDALFDDNEMNCFTFSTTHKAKGLENDVVYVLGIELFPLKWKNQQEWELQQEKNIKYVSLTRSKRKLVLVSLKIRE
jgi:superfamily I DNA/RNA helicase